MSEIKVPPVHEFAGLTSRFIGAVVELDTKSCTFYDQDFELQVVHNDAWTETGLRKFLKQRLPQSGGYVMRLPESAEPERVVAYMAYELTPANEDLGLPECIHLVGFVVDPEFRRQALGWTMLLKLYTAILESPTRKVISIHVREDDKTSIAFFADAGFKSRLVRSYYSDGSDAYLFTFTETRTESRHASEKAA